MKIIKGYFGLALGLFMAGIVAIIAGGSHPSDQWSLWLTSTGGAVLGASVGAFLGAVSAQDILLVLKQSFHGRFTSPEPSIRYYRKKWYNYNVGKKGGRLYWRCSIVDFSCSVGIGKLTTNVSYEGKDGQIYHYTCEAGIRGSRFVVFTFPAPPSQEAVCVCIYARMGMQYLGYYSGLSFLQTWDDTDDVMPVLMSPIPLHGVMKAGDICGELAASFDETWLQGMVKGNSFVPLVTRPGGDFCEYRD